MSFPVSHKTVFILDHGPSFSGSCQQPIEFDIFTKTRQPGIIPLAPITKSLWTCSVEAAIEYCRIVWDIFPTEKLIRFVVSDSSATTLNSWLQEEQILNHLMTALAQIGPIQSGRKQSNILAGLNAAIEALCHCSEVQHEKRTSLTESAGKVMNRGRVICITSFKMDSEVRNLEESFQEALVQHNKLAASSDRGVASAHILYRGEKGPHPKISGFVENLMPIHHCELVVIHTYPVSKESCISPKAKREVSSILTSEVHSTKSGRVLSSKLVSLVQQHYNLASTTVTGIPMKEEQNANSSANYDVELLHPATAHAEVFKTGVVSPEGTLPPVVKDGQLYETVTLKWCTPRSNAVELQYCTSAFRITPVDVNGRPSSCLTNFLLNGRAVMLEMPRKSGSKVMSHMLSSHGGEIFIHTLGTGRSILEDPPSISEGSGGRVTDYRITDFGEFMKQNRLVPCNPPKEGEELAIEIAKKRLSRLTQYWPMVISHTTIFNMSANMSPLLSLITKESLTQDEVVECKKVIYQLVGFESKGMALPVPTVGTRGKGPKREEQYRMMWNELEAFVRCHCITAEHRSVLECLLECRKPNSDGDSISSLASMKLQLCSQGVSGGQSILKKSERLFIKEESSDSSKLFESDDIKRDLERSKDYDSTDDSLKLFPAKKARLSSECIRSSSSGPQSLLALWTNRINSEHANRHPEFAGRQAANGGVAKLYPNLKIET